MNYFVLKLPPVRQPNIYVFNAEDVLIYNTMTKTHKSVRYGKNEDGMDIDHGLNLAATMTK